MELSLMSSSNRAHTLVAFNQEHGICRPLKELLSIVPSTGRKQEILRTGFVPSRSPLVGDPFKPMGWMFSDQCARLDSTTTKPVLIDVQDARYNSILLSFGISENCTRHEKILQYLMTGSIEGIDYSLLSSLTRIQRSVNGMHLLPFVPRSNGAYLYEIDSQSSVIYPSDFYAHKPLLGPVADLAHFSKMTVHPDGRILLTGNDFEMKDLMSIFEEFKLNSVKRTKQPMLVPHFKRPDTNESPLNVHGSSLKMKATTFTPKKSPAKIELKPSPKKRSSRKAGKQRDLYRTSAFDAIDSLIYVIINKNRGKAEILNLKKSCNVLSEFLNKSSTVIFGIGSTVLVSVACSISNGRVSYPLSIAIIGFGSTVVYLSWWVHRLRVAVVEINERSCKACINDKKIMNYLDKSAGEIFKSFGILILTILMMFGA